MTYDKLNYLNTDEVPRLNEKRCVFETFDSVIIVPCLTKHDSGFMNMNYFFLRGNKVVGKLGGASDVLHIKGKDNIKIDCTPGGFTRVLSNYRKFRIITSTVGVSDFNIVLEGYCPTCGEETEIDRTTKTEICHHCGYMRGW